MPLPRPARLLRQSPALLYRRLQSIAHVQSRNHAASATAPRVTPSISGRVEIDESYRHLLDDVRMRPALSSQTEGPGPDYLTEGVLSPASGARGEEGSAEDYLHEWQPREERRSPAAVLGSKRIGLVVLPEQLVDGIQAEINTSEPRDIRAAFLSLNPTTSSPRSRSLSGGRARKATEEEQRQRSSAPAALAKAAAFMPGEYAAVRNVLREMKVRLGDGWLDEQGEGEGGGGRGVVEVSGSLGSGVWALADVMGKLEEVRVREIAEGPEAGAGETEEEVQIREGTQGKGVVNYAFVHPGRAGVELADRLFERLPAASVDVSTTRKLSQDEGRAPPAIALSTFHLSTLPTRSSRLTHLRTLLSSSPRHIVLVDRSTPQGWEAISEARAFMLGLPLPSLNKSQDSRRSKGKRGVHLEEVSVDMEANAHPQRIGQGYHVLAPCPHDGACPILASPAKDICSFSQRLQRPSFLRRTKHAQKGEEDMGYTYVVFSKGERPAVPRSTVSSADAAAEDVMSASETRLAMGDLGAAGAEIGTAENANGRMGGVGREEREKARAKVQGKSVLREVEGGGYEMVSLAEIQGGFEHIDGVPVGSRRTAAQDEQEIEGAAVDYYTLRREAYSWPRLVAPPIKRSGHVVMDVCSANGTIHRQTYAKSHSKQGYHDARKAAWGDLFPHEPKGKLVERERGVRRLAKVPVHDEFEIRTERQGGDGEENEVDVSMWPTAELVPEDFGQGEGKANMDGAEVITWTSSGSGSGRSGKGTGKGKGREYSTSAIARAVGGTRMFSSSARVSSVHPPEQPKNSIPGSTSSTSTPTPGPRPKVTIAELYRLKASSTPITCLTAYDYPTALLSQHGDIDMVLVGDSLAQVCLGHDTTTRVTLDEMIHHAAAVTRGAKTPFVFADLPFGSFEASVEQGVRSVVRLVKEAGVDGVKIEGGREILPLVKTLSNMGIAVMPHLGLQPQRATALSGYRVQARGTSDALDLYSLCREMKDAGAFALLLEAIPRKVAEYITKNVDIVTIGIGAGEGTAGQVLVITDVLGTYAGEGEWKARFVRHFGEARVQGRESVKGFKEQVRGGGFPAVEESYGMKREEWDGFVAALEGEGGGGQGAK